MARAMVVWEQKWWHKTGPKVVAMAMEEIAAWRG